MALMLTPSGAGRRAAAPARVLLPIPTTRLPAPRARPGAAARGRAPASVLLPIPTTRLPALDAGPAAVPVSETAACATTRALVGVRRPPPPPATWTVCSH